MQDCPDWTRHGPLLWKISWFADAPYSLSVLNTNLLGQLAVLFLSPEADMLEMIQFVCRCRRYLLLAARMATHKQQVG